MNKLNKSPNDIFLNLPSKHQTVAELRSLVPLPIAIVGMGVTGQATLDFLLACQIPREMIFTFDEKSPADFSKPEDLASSAAKTYCVSPGVNLKKDWLQQAFSRGIKLTSELSLAFSLLDNERVIAITGAVGKSTTTSVLGVGCQQADKNCFVGGNLGTTLAQYVGERIKNKLLSRANYIILELSSYQLENFANLQAEVGIITSLNPNHLERYRDLEDYYQTKISLFNHVTQVAILNQNGGDLGQYIPQIKQRFPHLQCVQTSRQQLPSINPQMIGAHNLDNLAMAFAVADYFAWPTLSKTAMMDFPGLAHRLENCGSKRGVVFVNDSKATTMSSVLQAVRSLQPDNNKTKLHLLLGGRDKNLPWNELSLLIKDTNLLFYFFGEFANGAKTQSQLQGPCFAKLGECLSFVETKIQPGDLVLLSPGGTSWDEFKSFEDRGNFFKNWVSTL